MTIKRMMVGMMVLAGLMLAGLPLWVTWSDARHILEDRLEKHTGGEVRIAKLSGHWLPRPHVVLSDARIDHKAFGLRVPSIRVYPDLSALLRGRAAVGSLRLIRPECVILSLPVPMAAPAQTTAASDQSFLPLTGLSMDVIVEEGRVVLPVDAAGQEYRSEAGGWTVSDIQLLASLSPEAIRVDARCRSSFADTMTLELDLMTPPGKDRVWDLDAGVRNLNLEPFWALLEGAFGLDHPISREVRTMVGSGHMKTGEFRFRGTDAQWTNPERLEARAELADAIVRIPGTGLTAREVSGHLAMDHGLLTGRSIVGRLGQSMVTGGMFELGLSVSAPRFTSEMVIDTDVSELPDALNPILARLGFHEALDRFTMLEGRALVHLSLGDRLDDLRPVVRVSGIRASCFDRRIDERLSIGGGILSIDADGFGWDNLAGFLGDTAIVAASGHLSWGADPVIILKNLNARVDADALYTHLKTMPSLSRMLPPSLTGIEGWVDLYGFQLRGSLKRPETLVYQGTVSTRILQATVSGVPAAVRLATSGLDFSDATLATRTMTVSVAEQVLTLSGQVNGLQTAACSGTVTLRGTVLPVSAGWLRDQGLLPAGLFPRLPCDLDPLVFRLQDHRLNVSGTIRHFDDHRRPILTTADVELGPRFTEIRHLALTHDARRIEIRGMIPGRTQGNDAPLNLHAQGQVALPTLMALLDQPRGWQGVFEGDLHLTWPQTQGLTGTVAGHGTMADLVLTGPDGTGLELTAGQVQWEGDGARWRLDDVTLILPDSENKPAQRLIVSGLGGSLTLLPGPRLRTEINEGRVCGVRVTGNAGFPDPVLELDFKTDPDYPLPVERLMTCLGVKDAQITGQVGGDMHVNVTPAGVDTGRFTIRATEGVIDKARILSKIFALLDLTELFSRQPLDHMMTSGYRYDTMDISGTIDGRTIHVDRAQIVGVGINFYATGRIDLETRSLDLVVLASPFKAVDRLIDQIPVVGRLLGGKNRSVLSVPVTVEGHLSDPGVRILPKPVSAVSSTIVDTLVQAFKLPFVFSYELVTDRDP